MVVVAKVPVFKERAEANKVPPVAALYHLIEPGLVFADIIVLCPKQMLCAPAFEISIGDL
ncbi:MAG: hypothetical protein IPH32_13810 [Bacteroidetes bacterium]|nr:hypothetical protein [Bacteroidota bacterium]